MATKPRKPKIHIALSNGEWYAHAQNRSHETRCALVPAISFCDRLNAKQGRGKSLKAKRAARRWADAQGR